MITKLKGLAKFSLKTCIVVLLIGGGYLNAQTRLYVHENAFDYVSNTESIAIVPFKVVLKLRPKQAERLGAEELLRLEKETALQVQSSLYSFLLKRRDLGEFDKQVQVPARTNLLLQKQDILLSEINGYLPEELGKILGVDCIISGTFTTARPLSDGASIVLNFLGSGNVTNKSVTANIDFFDTRDNEHIVNYYKTVRGGTGWDNEALINSIMRKVTRRIPYTNVKYW